VPELAFKSFNLQAYTLATNPLTKRDYSRPNDFRTTRAARGKNMRKCLAKKLNWSKLNLKKKEQQYYNGSLF
jgi:hypothetical protein